MYPHAAALQNATLLPLSERILYSRNLPCFRTNGVHVQHLAWKRSSRRARGSLSLRSKVASTRSPRPSATSMSLSDECGRRLMQGARCADAAMRRAKRTHLTGKSGGRPAAQNAPESAGQRLVIRLKRIYNF
jgi:hypothetical protein